MFVLGVIATSGILKHGFYDQSGVLQAEGVSEPGGNLRRADVGCLVTTYPWVFCHLELVKPNFSGVIFRTDTVSYY